MPLRTPPSTRRQTTCRAGFSLVDVTITLLIMGVLAGVAIPRMFRAVTQYRADAAAARIAADLAYAGKYSRTKGVSETIHFNAAASQYSCSTIASPTSPAAVYGVDLSVYPYESMIESVSFAGEPSVTFDGHGFPGAGGQVVVKSGAARRTIRLEQATGNVVVESGQP